jgi:molybdopterin-guanine dinucleotide biosynthesis adapter protein
VKAVGIIGYKKSGKTTLGVRLAKELAGMGHRVGVVKHASCAIDFAEADTSKYRPYASVVSATSPGDTEIILRGEKSIEEILSYHECDIVLIEGFKREKTFPKIVCLRRAEEKQELFDGLELFTASFKKEISDYDIMDDNHLRTMAEKAIEKGFKLPKHDCGRCGHKTCLELARDLVRGKATIEKCVTQSVSMRVNGETHPLDYDLAERIRNSILRWLPSSGVSAKKIEIDLFDEKV